MATRTIFLASFRISTKQRWHFAIFVPSLTDSTVGTIINVIGAPMIGYKLEFKRGYCPLLTKQMYEIHPIGEVLADNIVDHPDNAPCIYDDIPTDNLEREAAQLPPPRISENFKAPVNDTTNRRCQEWTMDYVRRLVDKKIIAKEALDIVQKQRNPPDFGIVGLIRS